MKKTWIGTLYMWDLLQTRAKWSGQWRSVDKRVLPALILAQGRMFSVQQTLPRLPVPPLQQTLDKFLLSVKPILSEDEFQHAEKVSPRGLQPANIREF